MNKWLRKISSAIGLAYLCSGAVAQQADFNEVGRQMAIMLQNSHFARLPFNAELSKRFLEDYLEDLDFQRIYFTQPDIDSFHEIYGDKLHTLLLHGNGMTAATEIYEVFKKRVRERVDLTEFLLKGPELDFTNNDTIKLSRKNMAWPKDDQEAAELWKLQIKEVVLSETLQRGLLAKLAKEQGKPDPGVADRPLSEKISLRYKRFLNSVGDVSEEDVANYFLSAVARAYDPHTDYMSFSEVNRFKDTMKNELVGIGASLQEDEDGSTKIKGIVVDGPADRGNLLKLNDRVVAVDPLNSGKPEDMIDVMFMKPDKVVDFIRGKEGSFVGLKVQPATATGGESKVVVIQRGKVEMKDEQTSGEIVEMKSENGAIRKLGVITLPSFYADFDDGKIRSSLDVEKILKRLVTEKIDGLILDLRGNGGGSLEEVRRMTGFFTGGGPVVQVKNTLGQVQVKDADAGKPIYNGPMVVMTDKNSASASEILAGALQDFNRAVVVGDSTTFGKGTVQQPIDIGRMLPLFAARNHAGSLKVTIQKFYRPSGSSTQIDGVAANVVTPSMANALEVGEEFLDHPLVHDRIRPAADFKPMDAQGLFVPRLQELSQERIKASKDFSYIFQDIVKAKERTKLNQSSLNRVVREKELVDSDAMKKERNAERKIRFANMVNEDKRSMVFYKIKLDDLDKVDFVLKPYNPADGNNDFIRRAKDEVAELDETPKWPTGLDPSKRESLAVLKDLVDLTQNAKLAGLIRETSEVR